MAERLILSTGANGRFAGLVVPELVKRGLRVRGLVHKPDKAQEARAKGAAEVAVGDLRDVTTLDKALQGVEGVFYIAPAFSENERQLGLNMVAAAKRAGVRRFVFSSVIHPGLELENHLAKLPVESALHDSGMEFVVLHPAAFFQNIERGWATIVEHGIVAEPYSKKSRLSRVDYRDVAEAAAMGFTEKRLTNGTFELCAEDASREEIAQLISEVLGRKIEAGEPSFDDWVAKAQLPMDERQKTLLKRMFDSYDKYGLRGNGLVLRAILGREPRTLRQFVQELAARSKKAASG
jgi:uncharacterized protein YbjT (DUF2867 family)